MFYYGLNMDYFIGFLFGFFCKQLWAYLNELSNIREQEQIFWLDQDDLP